MNRLYRVGRWIADRLKDLFYGVGNNNLDHGRVAAVVALATMIWATAYNMSLKQPIDLGPAGLGGGLTAVLGALVVYMYKDRQQKGGGE